MSTYRDFNYFPTRKKGVWKVTFPSGWTTIIYADSEDALKTKIDEVVLMFEGEDA